MTGLLSGLGAAILMAAAFTCSGFAVRKIKNAGSTGILLRAHILMGILSLPGLLLVWKSSLLSSFRSYFFITLAGVLCYLLGQTMMFVTQQKVDSSRVVPLLGLKLVFLAVINGLILQTEQYGPCQYLAILCTLCSAVFLNKAGSRIPLMVFFTVLMACLGYSLSDTFMKIQMQRFASLGYDNLIVCALASTFTCYLLSGLISAVILPFFPRCSWKAWAAAFPFSLFWLSSIVLLFACFARLGTVNGNIIQSTRGIIAILIGGIIARLGFNTIEEKTSLVTFLKRLFAGFLMVLAIYLFSL